MEVTSPLSLERGMLTARGGMNTAGTYESIFSGTQFSYSAHLPGLPGSVVL